MDYLDIISVDDAKTYLGVDDCSRDREIHRMINSACSYVEKATNHIFSPRDKEYDIENGCVWIYDFPISTESDNIKKKSGYVIYTDTADTVELNIGYEFPDEIPQDLIDAAYLMINYLFYEQEGSGKMPLSIEMIIDQYRRFIL